MQSIDWGRVGKYLRDCARREGGDDKEALEKTRAIVNFCGPFTHCRVMAQRIGKACLKGKPCVIAPSCPDYPHDGERYTFQGDLSGGISLLGQRQLEFLERLHALIDVEVLYADQEADDAELCASMQVTHEEFRERVLGSVRATKARLKNSGLTNFAVSQMTERFPELSAYEREARVLLDTRYQARVSLDSAARTSLYQRIRYNMSAKEMYERTARTAAQYLALGQLAAENGLLIANHSTVNLSWYLQTEAGILHNPVSVY